MEDYQPLFHRNAEDHRSALRAFRRLYCYAVDNDNSALAAIAVLKALQKLENAADSAAGAGPRGDIVLPAWVSDGVWGAMRALLMKRPGNTPKGRKLGFKQETDKVVQRYRRWALAKKYADEHSIGMAAAVRELGDDNGASEKNRGRAVKYIENQIMLANQHDLRDDEGIRLQFVEARDLVPTQKIEILLADIPD